MRIDRSLTLQARIDNRRRRDRNRLLTLVSIFILTMMFILSGGFGLNIGTAGRAAMQADIPGETEGMDAPETTETPEITVTPKITVTPEGTNQGSERKDLQRLKNELAGYIKKFSGYYGIYYLDLTDGSSFGINENSSFTAASTIKIPINVFLYKKIADGSINRFGTMTYLKSDYEEGTGKIRYEKLGGKYTVKELSRLSIEISDNVAANILLRLLGKSNVKDYMIKLGGKVIDYDKNVTSPRDMAVYMKELYTFSRTNSVLGKELMGYFQNTAFNERLPLLLPKGTKVAHKIGNQVGAYHDIGIVLTGRPYIISIMSKNIRDEKEAFKVIANISKKVYDFVAK